MNKNKALQNLKLLNFNTLKLPSLPISCVFSVSLKEDVDCLSIRPVDKKKFYMIFGEIIFLILWSSMIKKNLTDVRFILSISRWYD